MECVVRGYIAGSGWKSYRRDGTICGHRLPEGLRLADRLPEPIFTPSTKAEEGHDENIPYEEVERLVGAGLLAVTGDFDRVDHPATRERAQRQIEIDRVVFHQQYWA